MEENLFQNSFYKDTKRITHFHRSVYTQNGEDGIIDEIFKRIGITNPYFVEFGVHGIKNNSTFLLLKGWSGLWIGESEAGKKNIYKKFKRSLQDKNLTYHQERITKDNIESIFDLNAVPDKFDFLSIDLDGNDYWIWQAISRYSPRLVSIEYNSTFPPDISCVMSYNAEHNWDQTSYFGSSLKALEILGRKKGYELIGCDFTGCNAFFIRNDQNLALFESPFTAENHYEPPRYFLRKPCGHTQGMGDFELIA
ncbi:MAG: hypothetical protein KFF73_07245 [Cyclobacteriaceae bacterium]|nr:hypothetical protein [Cyclobacteriaceae bacterium]